MNIDFALRERIAALPAGVDLDNDHIGGILARRIHALELLRVFRSQNTLTFEEELQLQDLSLLLDIDVPVMLRAAIQGGSSRLARKK